MSPDMQSWLSAQSASTASTSTRPPSQRARPTTTSHQTPRRPPAFLDLTLSDSSPTSPNTSSPSSIIFNSPDRRAMMDFSHRPPGGPGPSHLSRDQLAQRDQPQPTPKLFIGKRLFQGARPTQQQQQPAGRVFGEQSVNVAPAKFETGFRTGGGLKDRLTTEMNAQAGRIGVPIGVPSNPIPPRSAYKPSYAPPQAPADEDEAVLKAMEEMTVKDGASAEDQEKALKDLVAETVDMSEVDTSDPPPEELSCTLLPHQRQGLAWLRDREKGKKRGGILADDMGLGKTIQCLALILANPPTARPKTTLIVCPVALLDQWKDEIFNKSDAGLRVYIHHGPARTKEWDKLRRYDVVITSYPTCASEFASEPKPKKAKDGEAAVPKKAAPVKKLGPLFGGEYYRIILDEAHQIKNRNTQMHKACVALESKYRWALSGTPVQNSVDDLFALFEFLGKVVNPLHEYSEFKMKIGNPIKQGRPKLGMARLSVVLKAVMLRRTKLTLVDGKPLLQLPKREVIEVKGPFLDPEEQAFYKAVEDKMTLEMNKFIKAGTAMSNYTNVLILLLRMRQACSHPALVTTKISAGDDLELVPDTDKADGARAGSGASTPAPLDDLDDELDGLIGGLGGLTVKERPTCPLCAQPMAKRAVGADGEPPKVGGYCDACEAKYAAYGDLQFSTKVLRCLSILEDIKTQSRAPAESAGPAFAPVFSAGAERKPKTSKGEVEPAPEERAHKTIIFSQFTSFFDLLQPFLRKAGIRFVRLDGSMNTKQRAAALDRIKRNDDKYTAILVSIKAGSVGLNLTCCSRVILMDLWWNPAIEAQAFDRAHRFGQRRDVKIYKVTIDGTIEDRILELQKKKAELAAAALDGGDFVKGNKLSMKDMLSLFKQDGGHDDDFDPQAQAKIKVGVAVAVGSGAGGTPLGAKAAAGAGVSAAPALQRQDRQTGADRSSSRGSQAGYKARQGSDGDSSESEGETIGSDSDSD